MSTILGLRSCCARPALRQFQNPCHPRPPQSICRRGIFGVGEGITYASVQACKALLWGTVGVNIGVFAAWAWSGRYGGVRARVQNAPEPLNEKVSRTLHNNFMIRPDDLENGKPWTMLTSAFSHQRIDHILGNMFALYAFGSVLTMSAVPPIALASLMVGSALTGSVGYMFHAKQQENRMARTHQAALGASGMVMGMGTAAAMLAPNATMLLFGVVPCPMWVLAAGYFVYDTYYLNNPMSSTGHAAHIGGAVFGITFYAIVLRRLGGVLGGF